MDTPIKKTTVQQPTGIRSTARTGNPATTVQSPAATPQPVRIGTVAKTKDIVQLQKDVVELEKQQKDKLEQLHELEENKRREDEYHLGKKEVEDKLNQYIQVLNEELIRSRRETDLIDKTLVDLSSAHEKVLALDEALWAPQNRFSEISRALAIIENARMEINSTRVKLPIVDGPVVNPPRISSTKSETLDEILKDYSLNKSLKIGVVFLWPVLLLNVLFFIGIIVLLLKHF